MQRDFATRNGAETMASTERFRESFAATERDDPQAQHTDNHPTRTEKQYAQDITQAISDWNSEASRQLLNDLKAAEAGQCDARQAAWVVGNNGQTNWNVNQILKESFEAATYDADPATREKVAHNIATTMADPVSTAIQEAYQKTDAESDIDPQTLREVMAIESDIQMSNLQGTRDNLANALNNGDEAGISLACNMLRNHTRAASHNADKALISHPYNDDPELVERMDDVSDRRQKIIGERFTDVFHDRFPETFADQHAITLADLADTNLLDAYRKAQETMLPLGDYLGMDSYITQASAPYHDGEDPEETLENWMGESREREINQGLETFKSLMTDLTGNGKFSLDFEASKNRTEYKPEQVSWMSANPETNNHANIYQTFREATQDMPDYLRQDIAERLATYLTDPHRGLIYEKVGPYEPTSFMNRITGNAPDTADADDHQAPELYAQINMTTYTAAEALFSGQQEAFLQAMQTIHRVATSLE